MFHFVSDPKEVCYYFRSRTNFESLSWALPQAFAFSFILYPSRNSVSVAFDLLMIRFSLDLAGPGWGEFNLSCGVNRLSIEYVPPSRPVVSIEVIAPDEDGYLSCGGNFVFTSDVV